MQEKDGNNKVEPWREQKRIGWMTVRGQYRGQFSRILVYVINSNWQLTTADHGSCLTVATCLCNCAHLSLSL